MSLQEQLLERARQLDAQDPLRSFRAEFYLPQTGLYFDGNSLGPLSRQAERRLTQAIDDWKRLGIDGFTQAQPPWFHLAEEVAARLAPLVGACSDEVIAANSTSVNLHQILSTFYRPQGERTRIVIDEYAFPTDVYAVQSQMRLQGLDWRTHLQTVRNRNRLIEEDDIVAAIDASPGEIAMLVLPAVVYTTGQILDIRRLTKEAHRRGIHMAHEPSFAANAGAYQIGTPPVFSLCALLGSLELTERAGLTAIREKSLRQTRLLIDLVNSELAGFGFELATPDADEHRGGHVSIAHPEAARINKALKKAGVVPDFRPPDIIRLAPVALYTRYEEIAQVVLALKGIMERKAYTEFSNVREEVA